MKTTDLKPLMVFRQVSDLAGGPDVVIDEVLADGNGPHSLVCRVVGHHAEPLPFTVEAKEMVDARKWSFEPVLTAGAMHEKILYLQEYVRSLKKPPEPEKYGFGKAEPHEYVETNPYRGCGVCGIGPGAFHHNSHEVKRFLAASALKAAVLGCNDCGQPLKQGEMMVCAACNKVVTTPDPKDPTKFTLTFDAKAEPADPYAELSAVLWFLASLTSDHEPGCAIKQADGSPCDCEVPLKEGEHWWKRVRASLRLPALLKGRLEKAETLLKARRVVQVKPVAGAPGPSGDGTVYEFKMPNEKVERLIVVRYEPGTLSPEQMRYTSEGLRKKLPGALVLFAQPNWELTVLELP